MVNFNLPSGLGEHLDHTVNDNYLMILGTEALLVVKEHSLNARKRMLFHYSTRFALQPGAFVCAGKFLLNNRCVLGFSDGAVIVIHDFPPEDGWDDCNSFVLGRLGPPVISFATSSSKQDKNFLLAIGQRTNSERHAIACVYNLKTRVKVNEQLINDYTTACLDLNRIVHAKNPDAVDIACGLRVEVCQNRLYSVRMNEFFDQPFTRFFTHDEYLVLLTGQQELLFTSIDPVEITTRVYMKDDVVLDVLPCDSVVIVLTRDNLHIFNASGGRCLLKKKMRGHAATGKILNANNQKGMITFIYGNEIHIATVQPPSVGKKPFAKESNKKKATLQKSVNHSIREGLGEINTERREETRMEAMRSKMNIDGLTEEELIQYAQMLSLEP